MKREFVLGLVFRPGLDVVFLIRKNRPDWQAGHYNGIGGRIEPDESPRFAMSREYKEETGATVGVLEWRLFCLLRSRGDIVHCFCAESAAKVQSKTDEEVFTCHVACLPPNALPQLRWMIPMAIDRLADRDPDCVMFTIAEERKEKP